MRVVDFESGRRSGCQPIALINAFGRKQIAVYLWIKRGGQRKRKNKFIIHNEAEWQKIKEAIDTLSQSLP